MKNYNKLIQKYAENKLPKTIVTDFDATITIANKYPGIAPPNHLFIEKLKDIKSKGYKIIISSCRWSTAIQPESKAKHQKEEVEKWLKENDVPYDELWADNKPFGCIYFDDKAVNIKDMDTFDERVNRLFKGVDPQPFEYSCLMAEMPHEVAEKTKDWGRENIPDEWLFDGDNAGPDAQRPDKIHVSVKYGLIIESLNEVKEFLDKQRELGVVPVKCRLGEISKFANDGTDVIKIKVVSEDLSKLHTAIGERFVNHEEFDKFEPHVTVAYCKPGAADKLIGTKIFGDKEFTLDEFVFSIASTGEQIPFRISNENN
jgi:hypothetical protein